MPCSWRIQRRGDLPDHGDHGLDGHVTHATQAMVEILPFQILHHQVGLAGFGLTKIDDVHRWGCPSVT